MEIPYKLVKEEKTIKGFCDLKLIVGNKYEIHYGIHQGIYEYIGQVSKEDKNHPFSHGQYLFKDCRTNEISFGYYCISPFEFTSIIKAITTI